jgi:hypothetical protein
MSSARPARRSRTLPLADDNAEPEAEQPASQAGEEFVVADPVADSSADSPTGTPSIPITLVTFRDLANIEQRLVDTERFVAHMWHDRLHTINSCYLAVLGMLQQAMLVMLHRLALRGQDVLDVDDDDDDAGEDRRPSFSED